MPSLSSWTAIEMPAGPAPTIATSKPSGTGAEPWGRSNWNGYGKPDVYAIQMRSLDLSGDAPVRLSLKQFLRTDSEGIFNALVSQQPEGFWNIPPDDLGLGGVHAPGILRVPRFPIVFDDEVGGIGEAERGTLRKGPSLPVQ